MSRSWHSPGNASSELDKVESSSHSGMYRLQRCLIELAHDRFSFESINVLHDDLEPTEHLHVFIHEYLHFLQNVSTPAGVSEFVLWGEILAAFTRALAPSGRIDTAPAEDVQRQVKTRHAALQALTGDRGPRRANGWWDVMSYSFRDCDLSEIGFPARSKLLTLQFRCAEGGDEVTFEAGTLALYEGLAYECDQLVCRTLKVKDDEPSFFPYQVLRAVGFYHGIRNPVELISLAQLALSGSDPWLSLMNSLERFQNLCADSEKFCKFLETEIALSAEDRIRTIDHLLDDGLPRVRSALSGRGPIKSGMDRFISEMDHLLKQRKEHPIFELNVFSDASYHHDRFKRLLQLIRPCDVLELGKIGDALGEEWDRVGRDVLRGFRGDSLDALGLSYSQGVRALEAAITVAMIHLGKDGFVLTESLAFHREKTTCPFFGACNLKRRIESQETCTDAPWEHWVANTDRACWYSVAIAGALGNVMVNSVVFEEEQEEL